MELKEFVLGKGKIPSWFNEKCQQGKAKVNYDDENNVVGATIHTPTKTITAKIGDSIMLLKSGLQVIPKEKAVKYKVQKGTNDEENLEQNKGEVG